MKIQYPERANKMAFLEPNRMTTKGAPSDEIVRERYSTASEVDPRPSICVQRATTQQKKKAPLLSYNRKCKYTHTIPNSSECNQSLLFVFFFIFFFLIILNETCGARNLETPFSFYLKKTAFQILYSSVSQEHEEKAQTEHMKISHR
jgi:hypothetical protein